MNSKLEIVFKALLIITAIIGGFKAVFDFFSTTHLRRLATDIGNVIIIPHIKEVMYDTFHYLLYSRLPGRMPTRSRALHYHDYYTSKKKEGNDNDE